MEDLLEFLLPTADLLLHLGEFAHLAVLLPFVVN